MKNIVKKFFQAWGAMLAVIGIAVGLLAGVIGVLNYVGMEFGGVGIILFIILVVTAFVSGVIALGDEGGF